MTDDMHVPAHITLTRRIAQQETAAVTALTVEEQQLTTEYDKHQAEYEAERNRLDAELREAAEKAKQHLDRLAAAGQRLSGSITDVGRRLRQHSDEATEAQQTVLDWCTRRGISPADLPPLHDTGPMPAIQAPEPKQIQASTLPTLSPCASGEHARCAGCEDCPQGCHPEPAGLPALDEPDSVLAMGARMADPNATRADLPAGGDGPDGPFQGGMESPAEPRTKRQTRRRTQSDRVNDQDGEGS
jgi:hypothetical protein